ncbi:MAG: gliding motility-associated C-terminal domain-containing protein, partial [Cyclobacteriaceae bacterium]
GVPDEVEIKEGTDPNDPKSFKDTDGDGVPDYVETVLWPNQGLPEGDPTDPDDGGTDSDGDGVSDYQETKEGTDPKDPKKFKDSDGDLVPDDVETKEGTDPNDPKKFKDTDRDGVPDNVERQDGTSFTNAEDFTDSDKDGLPDYLENEQGTDPLDPSDFKDTDGDGVPDYVEIKEGTNPTNASNFKDSDDDGVADYIQVRSIEVTIKEDVVIVWGDENYRSALPTEIEITLVSGVNEMLEVVWNATETVNVLKRGTYELMGTLVIPKGIYNPYLVEGSVGVTVQPKPSPLDVTINNNTFEATSKSSVIPVGTFVVNDPVDDIHTVSLDGDGSDNSYFEIKDNILYWNSSESLSNRTSFSIAVLVTDRDGNVIDKTFEIIRTRAAVSSLVIANTFTPNGDGSNDTWGVNDLRFYEGVLISVYERGGSCVFLTENPENRWDGTYNGKEMPVGSYFWVIQVGETGETRRGILNLFKK